MNVSGLFTVEWFALIAEKTTFDLGTLDSGERSLPFGLFVSQRNENISRWNEIFSRRNENFSRRNEILFRRNEIFSRRIENISRRNEIFPRRNENISRRNEIYSRTNENIYRRNDNISRRNEIFSRTNENIVFEGTRFSSKEQEYFSKKRDVFSKEWDFFSEEREYFSKNRDFFSKERDFSSWSQGELIVYQWSVVRRRPSVVVRRLPHFQTWISLKPVAQSWWNFMCSFTEVGERLHKVLGSLAQNSGFHGNRKPPLTSNGENDVSPFSRLFLIRSILYLR